MSMLILELVPKLPRIHVGIVMYGDLIGLCQLPSKRPFLSVTCACFNVLSLFLKRLGQTLKLNLIDFMFPWKK